MSQIENVITTTLRARGGNVVSQMGQWSQGFGQIGGKINETTRMSERLNNQWRAIGTTLRYAVAGSVIFGLTRMVGQVKDLNVQLGQMQALSDIGGGGSGRFSDRDITSLFQNLTQTAVDTITPLTDVNQAAINFLSTVQGVKPSELPKMLTEIGQGAKLAQTNMEDFTQAATTAQIAFRRPVNPTTIGQFQRMFTRMIGIVPGGSAAGTTIAQSMPGLASMFQLAPGRAVAPNVAQAQMFGITQAALMTGMPAATAMRGLTYLLQSIAQPTGGARQALAGIGISPQFVQQQGIFAALMKLLHTISPVSKTQAGQLGSISDDALDQLDSSGGNLPGIPANEMSKLRTMIPRIHGIRAAIILASQLQQQGNVGSVTQDVQHMVNIQDQYSAEAKENLQAWQDFRKRARLAEAANAINAMSLQVAQTFEPVLGFVAQHVLDPVAAAARRHPTATKVAALSGAAFLGALGVGRFLGKFGGGTFVKATAAEAALSGNTVLGGSPQNPLYVIVVGQIFGGSVSAPTPTPSPGGGSFFSRMARRVGTPLGLFAASKYGVNALKGLGGALAHYGAETPALGDFISSLVNEKDVTTGQPVGFWRAFLGQGDFKNAQDYATALHRAQKLYPNTTGIEHFSKRMVQGRADVYLTLDQTDAAGKHTTKRVHVPIDLWSGGRVPMTTGKTGTTRRGK